MLADKKKEINFEDINPVFEVKNDIVLFKTGDIAFYFDVEGVEMEKWDYGNYDAFNTQLQGLYKSLPNNTIIQKLDVYFNQEHRMDREELKMLNGNITRKINEHFIGRKVLHHKSFLTITFPL